MNTYFKGKTENVKEMSGLWGVWFCALGDPSVTAIWGSFPVLPLNPHSDSTGGLLSALILWGWGGLGLRAGVAEAALEPRSFCKPSVRPDASL